MIEFQTAVFYILAAILLFAALRVITARDPVTAVLHLILAFFSCAGVWVLLQAEFLAIALILIYVGAVMVLFLFVVMMLDIRIDRLREGFWQHLPLGVVTGTLMAVEATLVFSTPAFRVAAADVLIPPGVSNTREIGALMFSDYVYPFELASLILLVGMIAAIVLTKRDEKKMTKNIDPAKQVAVDAKDRMRIVEMPIEKD